MDNIVSSTTNQFKQQTDTASTQDVFSGCPTETLTTGRDLSVVCFKVNEIVCLENDRTYLYGEVIQLLLDRGLCWFRPICLIVSEGAGERYSPAVEAARPIDLQFGSDLFWPISLFRPVLDTEVVNFLPLLSDRYSPSTNKSPNRQYLNRFIQQVWQNNIDHF